MKLGFETKTIVTVKDSNGNELHEDDTIIFFGADHITKIGYFRRVGKVNDTIVVSDLLHANEERVISLKKLEALYMTSADIVPGV